MDFTNFVSRETIPALSWLGKRDWLDFGYNATFNDRTIWTRPKIADLRSQEIPAAIKPQVERILLAAGRDVVNSFLALALSKSIAYGPKVFQPTFEDCVSLENTECNMSFADYKQPYPAIIIEFPKEYKHRLAQAWKVPKVPSHMIVLHDSEKGFINVNAFFDRQNVLAYMAAARPEYETIEDAIVVNRRDDSDQEYRVAELAQRLAVNFCMVMVLMGVRQTGPLEPAAFAKAQKMAKAKDKRKAELGQKLINSALYKVEFIQQRIKLYEEEFLQPRQPTARVGLEVHRPSPKPHWRRGHYRQQPFGPGSAMRKLIFIKPILVCSDLFSGDLKNTEVMYKVTTREDN